MAKRKTRKTVAKKKVQRARGRPVLYIKTKANKFVTVSSQKTRPGPNVPRYRREDRKYIRMPRLSRRKKKGKTLFS